MFKYDLYMHILSYMSHNVILLLPCYRMLYILLKQNAVYFCNGCTEDETEYRHYALSIPLYTHFTSPIRRFPDILVHRALAGALGKYPYIHTFYLFYQEVTRCQKNERFTLSCM